MNDDPTSFVSQNERLRQTMILLCHEYILPIELIRILFTFLLLPLRPQHTITNVKIAFIQRYPEVAHQWPAAVHLSNGPILHHRFRENASRMASTLTQAEKNDLIQKYHAARDFLEEYNASMYSAQNKWDNAFPEELQRMRRYRSERRTEILRNKRAHIG